MRGRLTEIAEQPRYGFTAKAEAEPVGPRFVRITDLQDGKIDWATVPFCRCDDAASYLLSPGDILFARTGATTGKTHIVREADAAVFASYLIRVRPGPRVRPEFLYAFFQSDLYWQQIAAGKEGSAQPNVNGQKLLQLRLPVPDLQTQESVGDFLRAVRERQDGIGRELPHLAHPLTDVRRIVAKIEQLAAKIEEARGLRRDSAHDAEAVSLAAATAAIRLAGAAEKVQVHEIADVRGGIQKGPHRIPREHAVRYLTVAHVMRNHLLLADERFFEVSPEELGRWRLCAGDVLIIEGNGSADQIGRTALFRGEIDPCVHQNHVIRMRPAKTRVDPEYLNAYFNSPIGQDAVQERSRTTSGLRSLSVGRIKEIEVLLPHLTEQRRIVERLEALQAKVDALKALQAQTAGELDALLPSILERAFKGEL